MRCLQLNNGLIDFSSNDYLGLAQSAEAKEANANYFIENKAYKLGATGSRLISGNSAFAENLENEIAQFHKAEAGLIFNSGYDANLGLFACIAQKGDTIICDENIHACIIDGARLSFAQRFTFKHNNLESLENKLKNSQGNIFIAVESVYSMDGDMAPLKEISALAKKYNANIIVDEAHAIGIIGKNGEGLVQHLGLQNHIFARVVTFGKALGCHGAIVLGSNKLKNYLINFARSFIYTTALPLHSLVTIQIMYAQMAKQKDIELLNNNISHFKSQFLNKKFELIESDSAIQCLIIPGNEECKNTALFLQQKGFDVRAILSPTVATTKERLRICLHAFNSNSEITALCNTLILRT
ncbi:MAG: pyridoxal phosphate-dependent aminotransferase family protein [Sphingobacteriales bacterium]|nr:MAG: pyridoxal phosphate-dependent aminotransferase family protein [Sphingobacteriales bacterium]